eukprot:NODE_9399_length_1427_cov_3.552308.p1 GENE.NODE_9399_length_1427_cov_3.552308~~NODE_9399_length_1427_cov_3.552308.p1  ORF type:complete len:274 (+),score=60.86 NODE_9399_length_1427_cov_3.552308:61-882(+)
MEPPRAAFITCDRFRRPRLRRVLGGPAATMGLYARVAASKGCSCLAGRSAARYGVPFDVTLLSSVLAGMFCATMQTGRHGGPAPQPPLMLPLTMYAPMRDGELNDAMVGLFSDWRDLTVPCSSQCTALGLLLDVADAIRHRRWAIFDPLQNMERILVNILPLDEQDRGVASCSGRFFRQTRAHDYRDRRLEVAPPRSGHRARHRPMRITLEQESWDIWWIVLDINASHYPTEWCRRFAREFRRAIEDLAVRPLSLVLPSAASATPAMPAAALA